MANELLQRRFFDFCQSFVAIAKNPVHGSAFLIKNHLDIGKCKRRAVITAIIPLILFPCDGSVVSGQLPDDLPPSGAQLFLELSFSSGGETQRFAVDEFDFLPDGMNTFGGYQCSAVDADKAAAKYLRQFIYGGIGFVGFVSGNMDDRSAPHQLNIEDVLCRQADAPAVGNYGNMVRYHSVTSRSVFFSQNTMFSDAKQVKMCYSRNVARYSRKVYCNSHEIVLDFKEKMEDGGDPIFL